jgi:hypothetical protein
MIAAQTPTAPLRQARACGVHLPAWIKDFHLYEFRLPSPSHPAQPVIVIKHEGGKQKTRAFDPYGRCRCEAHQVRFRPLAFRCRHEAMLDAIRRYFVCPICGPADGPIHHKFRLRGKVGDALVPRVACLCCEARIASAIARLLPETEHPLTFERTTLHADWIGRPLTIEEACLCRAMLAGSKRREEEGR